MRKLWRPVVTGAVLALGLALLPSSSASADTRSPDGAWSVTPIGGAYQITLKLDNRLATRDASPELAVDGRSLGAAQQSQDGRTLTLVTTDPAAAHPSSVRLAWNGVVPGTNTRKSASVADVPAGVPITSQPTAKGTYQVTRADYDFGDTALNLSGVSGLPVEERAAVWVPVGASGARPVVVFLHGRADACRNPGSGELDNANWPCATGFEPMSSYLGYAQAAETLASRGYVVVSVSANAIGVYDQSTASPDRGGLARGQLVMTHLDLLAKANAGTAAGMSALLKGKLDLSTVGLMGHSRGGDGAVRAALLNAARQSPYGVKGVLALAPINRTRPALPDVPLAVLLPYCDGDVANQEGQHFYEDTRYTRGTDSALKTSLLMMGADHNYFNDLWSDVYGDDWDAYVDPADPTCGTTPAGNIRLSRTEQQEAGVAYTAGFFRLTLGRENGFLPMFQSNSGSAVQVGAATVLQAGQSPAALRVDVAPLQAATSNVVFSGKVLGQYCASIAGRSPQSGLPSCSDSTFTSRFPAFTPVTHTQNVPASPMLHLTWANGGQLTATMPSGRYNVSKYGALTLRASLDAANTATDLTLTVVDGSGNTQSTTVSALSDALEPLPAGNQDLLPKTWLRTVRWPVSQMIDVNTADIRQIRITTAAATGGVFLSDLAFTTAGVGSGAPTTLPQLSVTDTTVNEDAGTVRVTVAMSKASAVPVTVHLQSMVGASGQIVPAARQVTIPAGQTSVAVTVPLVDNTTVDPAADTRYEVVLGYPTNAVTGKNTAYVTVHDDEA
jgi:dienelactone hydrolase